MICEACNLGFQPTVVRGPCENCGDTTQGGAAKLCEDCSEELGECEVCRSPLPDDPEDDSLEVEPTDDELDEIEDEEESDDDPKDDPPPDDGCGKDDC